MKNKEFYKLLKKSQSNSGFTLTELLVGLVMSIFVIGALGFGLMTVLATSQSENSKVKARTENSRALDFVSDEVRRARTIETNATNAPRFTISDATVVLALDIPIISDSATLDTDSDADTKNERIVYYLKSTDLGNWKGPQVLYRWGPPLNANGEYSPKTGATTNHWTAQALLDGINNTTVSSPCATGTTVTPPGLNEAKGFYACLVRQDPTKPYQPDKTQADYNPSNTAQLFLTGQTKTASGEYDDSQTNDSQVVARARDTLAYRTDTNTSVSWSVKSLGGALGCIGTDTWDMRTDFHTVDNPNASQTTKWIQKSDENKQPQPITINSQAPLNVTASAVNASGCSNDDTGNPGTTGNELLSAYANKVTHRIDFGNPITFNGDSEDETYNESIVKPTLSDRSHEAVQFFKKGSSIPITYGGFDANNDNDLSDPGDQASLGKFLFDQGLAIPKNTGDDPYASNTEFKILSTDAEKNSFLSSSTGLALTAEQKAKFRVLEADERIIAMEIGQKYPDKKNDLTAVTNDKNPGFDLQDNIFIVTSDVFKKKFNSTCFTSGGCI